MNKILLTDNDIELDLNENIKYEYTNDLINKLKLFIYKNTKLELTISSLNELKFDIQIEIMDNCKLEITEIKKEVKAKILNKYNLGKNSALTITKINDVNTINEKNIVNLNGENASVDVILKTVSKNTEKYDFVINHNAKKTNSNIITNGLNLSGKISFVVTTLVLKGMKDSVANQQNRIINLTENECKIKPNLLIEELDVIANHSALVGSFKDEEIFYMQRLGIDKKTSQKLLIEGFIKNNITIKNANILKKYWR